MLAIVMPGMFGTPTSFTYSDYTETLYVYYSNTSLNHTHTHTH